QMKAGNPKLSMDHRDIIENSTVAGEWKYELVSRVPRVYEEGDLLFGFSGGGPGYGDPLERDPDTVMEDLRKCVISDLTAQHIYKVAYDPDRRKVDPEKTKQLRQEERNSRLARGKKYEDFLRSWEKQSPPQEALQFYGTWPDAESTGPIFRP